MKNHILLFIVLFTTSNFTVKSQSLYEKGYFIDSLGVKTECLIDNKDWEVSPTEISYKIGEQSERQKIKTSTIKEFEIFGSSKFISKTIQIDKSSSDLSNLSLVKNPVWQTEKLLLKELVKGKASLYLYSEFNLTRYFYSVNDSSLQQLVYKDYQATNANGTKFVGTNNNFRQQLYAEVNNPTYKYDLSKISYDQRDLKKYFEQYNAQFVTTKDLIVKEKTKRDFLKTAVFAGVNTFSMNVKDVGHPINSQNFGTFISPSMGAEMEFTLPYTRDKWSFILQPTYSPTISGKIESLRYSDDKPMESMFSYQAIDIPLGLRYRYFVNKKLSINATCYDTPVFLSWDNTNIKVDRLDFAVLERSHRFAVGISADYKNYSFEVKAYENRNFLVNYRTWFTDFRTFSVYFKYRLVDLKINR